MGRHLTNRSRSARTSRAVRLSEDDPDAQRVLQRALLEKDLANAIVVAHDGNEALDVRFGRDEKVGPDSREAAVRIPFHLKLGQHDGLGVRGKLGDDWSNLNPATLTRNIC